MVLETEFSYTLVQSLSLSEGAVGKTVYGVQCHYTVDGAGQTATVADVSPNRGVVERLVETLERLQPRPEILPELVEDYLEEAYTLTK